MTEVNWDEFKVRCSAISCVLAESRENPCLTEKQAARLVELQGKGTLTEKMQTELADLIVKQSNSTKVVLSDTCQDYLIDEWAWQKEKMTRVTKEIMDIPQMEKGILVEADSLILLSKVDGVIYTPNVNEKEERERFYNDYLSGEPDAWEGKAFMGTPTVPDIKSIWDRPTFLCKIKQPLTKANDLQIKGYMDISGAPTGFVGNCLINMPPEAVEKVKWRLLSKMNVATDESPEFKAKWDILHRSMNFDHIPDHQKVFKKPVTRMTEFERKKLYDRVKVCREWLWQFDEIMANLNK
jgi:hypothetical protein